MKERVEKLVGDVAKDMWIGTFHSICVRILRRYIDRIGFESSFVIFDTTDQKALIKKLTINYSRNALYKPKSAMEKMKC